MAKNPYDGKVFEKDFWESCTTYGVIPIRLFDPVGRFKGVGNICDFIVYQYPSMYCLELKSTMGKRFSFSRITETQYNGLLEQVLNNDAVGGILIHFTEMDDSETVFVPIQIIQEIKEVRKESSISYEEAIKRGQILESKLKRTRFNYKPSEKFFREARRCQINWEEKS